MIQRTEPILADTAFDALEPVAANTLPEVESQPSHPLQKLHSLMRGRYVWIVLVSTVCASVGGWAGYTSWKPKYQSTGLVRIAPTLPAVIFDVETQSIPMYDGYIKSQMGLITSPRVIKLALETKEWRALGRENTMETSAEFKDSLTLSREKQDQNIYLFFEEGDPDAAAVSLRALIESYESIFESQDSDIKDQRDRILDQQRRKLQTDIKNRRGVILKIAEPYGTDDLSNAYETKFENLQVLGGKLQEIQLHLNNLRIRKQQSDQPQPVRDLEPFEITDQKMNRLMDQRANAEVALGVAGKRYKPKHYVIMNARKDLASIKKLIEEHAVEVNEQRRKVVTEYAREDAQQMADREIQIFEQQLEGTTKLLTAAQAELKKLGKENLDIQQAKLALSDLERSLEQYHKRIEMLDVESEVTGHLRVISYGEKPFSPTNTGTLKQLVFFGVAGGLSCGPALFLLIGLMDRRYRYIEDAHEGVGNLRMLGVLPQLPEHMGKSEQAAMAAHAVQQIRTMLQMGPAGQRPQVFVVTSSKPGDGKTSLAMALGLSFAAANSRTLLIDFDLSGRGLSKQADTILGKRIGEVMLREGLINDEQLNEALLTAKRSRKRLGEALIHLEYLREEDIDRVLSVQADKAVGLPEVLDGGTLQSGVHETGMPMLSILPVGNASADLVSSLSPAAIGRVFDLARQQYNTVIIDTGPVPVSIEASLVSAQADGVIFTVAQGVHQQTATKALAHLKSIGGNVAGVVFNRANPRNLERYSTSASTSGRSQAYPLGAPDLVEDSASQLSADRYGLVASATARLLPAGATGKGNGNGGNGHGRTPANGHGSGRSVHHHAGEDAGNESYEPLVDPLDGGSVGLGGPLSHGHAPATSTVEALPEAERVAIDDSNLCMAPCQNCGKRVAVPAGDGQIRKRQCPRCAEWIFITPSTVQPMNQREIYGCPTCSQHYAVSRQPGVRRKMHCSRCRTEFVIPATGG